VTDPSALRQALVDELARGGHLGSPAIERAFRDVPRHLFLPDVAPDEVYRDRYIATKKVDGEVVSSSSQPQIMAIMLDQLGLEPGHRVLEIGAGTGYNAALMAHIVGDTGEVTALDLDQDIVDGARAHLAAAGFERVRVVCADGGFGYPEAAPYDRIILTVAGWDVTPAWREQLEPAGRLVLPLALGGSQKSVAFERRAGHLASLSVRDCLFMTLRGAFAAPARRVPLGPGPGLNLWVKDPAAVDAGAAHALLTGPHGDIPVDVRVTPGEVYGGLIPWVALRDERFCWLERQGPETGESPVPHLFALARQYASSAGLFEGRGAAFLMRPPGEAPPVERVCDPPAFDLFLRVFGESAALAWHLLDEIRAWDVAGRPGTEGLRILAYPIQADYRAAADEIVVARDWTRFVLGWPSRAGRAPGAGG
jgi:protein-L-isoaspartate(D-aspartate) O-methyltransferase